MYNIVYTFSDGYVSIQTCYGVATPAHAIIQAYGMCKAYGSEHHGVAYADIYNAENGELVKTLYN